LPRRLLLKGAEGFKVTLRVDDPFHGGGTEAPDVLRAPHRHDDNALSIKGPTTPSSERLERERVAASLDQHDRARGEGLGRPPGVDVVVDSCPLAWRHLDVQ
jgi:hypothetical protein